MSQASPADGGLVRADSKAPRSGEWTWGTHVPQAVAEVGSDEIPLRVTNQLTGDSEVEGPYQVIEAHVAMAGDVPQVVGMPAGTPVNWLHRVKLNSDDRPVSVELQMVSLLHAPRLLEEPLEELTVLSYLRAQQAPVARTRTYVEPAVLTLEMADELQSEPGQAVLRLRRLSWLSNGELIEVMTSTLGPTDRQLFNEHILPTSG